MSSHREAPAVSKDPSIDSTDLYAFVSPDDPDTVTIIANYIPLEAPDGGPNFYEFGGSVLYDINIDNTGNGQADISYQFDFSVRVKDHDTFLYNTGPIQSLTDATWNRPQSYSVTRIDHRTNKSVVLATDLLCPPCNIGPLSTPDYFRLADAAIHPLPGGRKVFAGQRADPFFVDLGAIFDLGILRPFQQDHTTFGLQNTGIGKMAAGVQSLVGVNVHSIAIQVPKTDLTANGSSPRSVSSSDSVVGIWTAAYRQKVTVLEPQTRMTMSSGPFVQLSRLGNPLFNEVLVPMYDKDVWNASPPQLDSKYAPGVANPELAQLLPALYPGVFPNLAAYNAGKPDRADLLAILLTGIPPGVVKGFQNYTGPTQADMLRLNMAIGPASKPSNLGLIGGDAAGFPNGRRLFDDVVTIELRALAGVTLPLVDPSYKPDAAAGLITPGLTTGPSDLAARGTEDYLKAFPYAGPPHQGYSTPSVTPAH